jgi:hypothetical protein
MYNDEKRTYLNDYEEMSMPGSSRMQQLSMSEAFCRLMRISQK